MPAIDVSMSLHAETLLPLTLGKSADTTPALARAPNIWATKTIAARVYVKQPMSVRPSVTAGLKRPPLMRKKTQALTARLKPNASAMYSRVLGDGEVSPAAEEASLATWVPANAKKRKRNVPTNSPRPCQARSVSSTNSQVL